MAYKLDTQNAHRPLQGYRECRADQEDPDEIELAESGQRHKPYVPMGSVITWDYRGSDIAKYVIVGIGTFALAPFLILD